MTVIYEAGINSHFGGFIQANPKFFKIQQSRADPQPKKIKEKSLDFLGFSCPNRAFSIGYADP
jgi:hypothetical protein